jgi:fructan beta-fructosidase
LKNWQSSGGFGLTYGATGGFWETPDLFELPVDGGPETRWVLVVGVQDNAPAGGSGTQYFVGQFDGQVFTSDNPKETTLWADYGADFYAAQGWTDAPGDTAVWAAWMNNWRYAERIPTVTWRGALTLPRTLSLRTTPEGIRLAQTPIAALENLRIERWSWEGETVTAVSPQLNNISGSLFEIIAEFPVNPNMAASRFGLRLRTGPDEQTTIGYVTREQKLFVDRTQSGTNKFSDAFTGVHIAPLSPIDGMIRLHIFVDTASVELFGNDGLVAITDQIFPGSDTFQIELFSDGGDLLINKLDIFRLNNAQFYMDLEEVKGN